MCGITAILHKDNQTNIINILYDMLSNLQHRGQDAYGFITYNNTYNKTYFLKNIGLIDKNTNNLYTLPGNMGIAHVRYKTSGTNNNNEIQPFYDETFHGISLVHNGNLVNTDELYQYCKTNNIILQTTSDSEILFKIFIYLLTNYIDNISQINDNIIKNIIKTIYDICKGSYSVIIMINNYGLITFRDIYGIRPLVYICENDYIAIASETIAFDNYTNYINVKNGDVIIIKNNNNTLFHECYNIYNYPLTPCLLEYIYFARPESYINDVLVYEYRELIADKLIDTINNITNNHIDYVIPIPNTGIITANYISNKIKKPLKYAIVKNRYSQRTFINDKSTIHNDIKKIKIVSQFVNNKHLLIIDDSIVRGNTSKIIIEQLRKYSVKYINFVSCCPPIKYPNKYGINISTYSELIAHNNTENQIKNIIGADKLYFIDLNTICDTIKYINPNITHFETSVFTGKYIF